MATTCPATATTATAKRPPAPSVGTTAAATPMCLGGRCSRPADLGRAHGRLGAYGHLCSGRRGQPDTPDGERGNDHVLV